MVGAEVGREEVMAPAEREAEREELAALVVESCIAEEDIAAAQALDGNAL